MKLLPLESEVLAAITLHADASISHIAKLVGARAHKCRHALERLLQRGMISRRYVINPARLGYQCYGLWFSLSPDTKFEVDQIVNALSQSDRVSYLGEYSGEYAWRADILARNAREADDFICALAKRFPQVFSKRTLINLLEIWDFSLKSLADRPTHSSKICVDFSQEELEISENDRRILREIARDGSVSQPALARKLGLPTSTINFRVNSLREKGVIVGCHMLPEVERLGDYELTFRLHRIQLRQPDAQTRKSLLKFAQEDPAVFGLTQCIGASDAEICAACKSSSEQRQFEARLKKALGESISSYTTLTMIKHHKVVSCP